MKKIILSVVLALASVCLLGQTHKIPSTSSNNTWTGKQTFNGDVQINGNCTGNCGTGSGGTGTPGPKGDPGTPATVTIGAVTTGAPGSAAQVTNSGTSSNPILNFILPAGAAGPAGTALNLKGTVADVASLPAGATKGDGYIVFADGNLYLWDGSTWSNVGKIQGPQGIQGITGPPGISSTVSVGNVVTGATGTLATITNRGTTYAAIFDFVIPRGATGIDGSPGSPGAAATINIGTVATGAAGSNGSVTNRGTTSAAILDFTLPRGADGSPGSIGPMGPQGFGLPLGTTTNGPDVTFPGKIASAPGTTTLINVKSLTISALQALTGNTTGDERQVSDGSTAQDCSTGGGTTVHWCRWSGTSWVSEAPVGSAGAVSSVNGQTGAVTLTLPQSASVLQKFLATYDATTGAFSAAQPSCGGLSDSGNACMQSTGTTSGTVAAGDHTHAVPVASGTTATLVGPNEVYVCTGTCTITVPVPAAGYQFCIQNAPGVSTAITLSALGSSAYYGKPDQSGYGTAGTGTLSCTAASANKLCIFGIDSTHYVTTNSTGSCTAN